MSETLSAQIDGVVISTLVFHHDRRGGLTELFRQDELRSDVFPVMAYISETLPGIGRGPHEHQYQTDLFVFPGPGNLKMFLWDARPDSKTCGRKMEFVVGESNPCRVIVPPGVVHGYLNISNKNALVFNAPNRLFAGQGRNEPVDEIRYENSIHSPYQLY